MEINEFNLDRLLQLDMLVRILLQMLLLTASAFFSGSETAMFSLSRLDLQKLRRAKHPRFEKLQALLEQPRQLIISILSGNEIINIAAAANMTGILVALYGPEKGAIINIIVMVPLLLLLGEVTPKTIAVSDPVKISTRIVAVPLTVWVKLVTPFGWLIRMVADRLTTLIVGEETSAENILKVDEFRTLIEEVVEGGELSSSERSLIYNLLEAGTTEVIEIMIPRTKTAFIDASTPVSEIVEQVRQLRYTRVPVYLDSRDHLVGFIHAEDIMHYVLDDTDFKSLTLDDILQPPVIVPPTKKVDEMFDFFLVHKVQAAAVLNEFGGIDGLVTLKSILNFVFGKITPETTPELEYTHESDNYYEVPGDMKLAEFNDVTNFGIDDPRMTTIGGVVLRALDRLPVTGDECVIEGVVVKVLEMRGHRIARVGVSKGTRERKEEQQADADKNEQQHDDSREQKNSE